MGLTTKDNHYKENEGKGWKVYLRDEDGFLKSFLTRDIVLENEWMLSEDRRNQKIKGKNVRVGENIHYNKGFHLYEFKPDSSYLTAMSMDYQSWIPNNASLEIREVEFKDVITSGTESRYFPVAMGNLISNVIIADKIKVLPIKQKINKENLKCQKVQI